MRESYAKDAKEDKKIPKMFGFTKHSKLITLWYPFRVFRVTFAFFAAGNFSPFS
jgi:hypothetical protein